MDFPKTYKNTKRGKYNWQYCWTVRIFPDCVEVSIPKVGIPENLAHLSFVREMWDKLDKQPALPSTYSIENISVSINEVDLVKKKKTKTYVLRIEASKKIFRALYSEEKEKLEEISESLLETQYNYRKEKAFEREKHLDYDSAINIYEKINLPEEAARVRSLKADLAAPKTVVQGDYVDDRDTIVKDSVISKSNIGAGGDDKLAKIKELKELLDSGAINEDDYEKMKREIIG